MAGSMGSCGGGLASNEESTASGPFLVRAANALRRCSSTSVGHFQAYDGQELRTISHEMVHIHRKWLVFLFDLRINVFRCSTSIFRCICLATKSKCPALAWSRVQVQTRCYVNLIPVTWPRYQSSEIQLSPNKTSKCHSLAP